MGTLWQDIRYGLRMLRRSPGFLVVALLTLALGIGANTAIFSFVNAVLLRPLPYEDPDRLVFISEWSQQVPGMSVSIPNFFDWRDQNQVFEQMAAFRGQSFNLTGGDEPEQLIGSQVTVGFFSTLGVKPILGRTFTAEEDKPGGDRVIVLSEALWQRRFGGKSDVLGQSLKLNGDAYTVIGVMPNSFRAPSRQVELWASLGRLADQPGMNNRGNHPGIYVFARLKSGVTVDKAQAEMDTIARNLEKQYPQTNTGNGIRLMPLLDRVVGSSRTPLFVLLAAVGFVLLIACANVANLLLARAAARMKEIAVRTALGAGRGRLVRQLLTESVMLSLVGGMLGLVLGYWAMRALVAAAPANTPRIAEVAVDRSVLIFTLGVAVLTGLLFGLAPALQASRPDLNETLKEGGRGSSGGGHHRLRRLLVISEVALSLVLLIGAGLMIRSFHRLQNAPLGFDPQSVLSIQLSLPQARYTEAEKRTAFFKQLMERLKVLPGVDAAGAITPLPVSGGGWQTSFFVEGRPEPQPGQAPSTDIARINADYFRVMNIPLLRGRYFTEQDIVGTPEVAIVDETFVRTYWPNEDPIGKRIKLGGPQSNNPWLTIVGVVPHVKNYGVDADSRVETYLPYMQSSVFPLNLVLRTAIEPSSVASVVRAAVREIDQDLPIYNIRTMEQYVSDQTAPRRLATILLGVFALVALILAAVGIYGVMSYFVSRRAHEIGIRLALGAEPRDILRMVVGQGFVLALIGMASGLAVALAGTRVMSGLLYGVSATDPLTFVGVSLFLIAAALLACYLPARRATKVDPIVALRYE